MDVFSWLIILLMGITATTAAIAISMVIMITIGQLIILGYRGLFKRGGLPEDKAPAAA